MDESSVERGIEGLTKEQIKYAELLTKEAMNPIEWWWLSFADVDDENPGAGKFLGVAIVPGKGLLTAVNVAKILMLNPGGEVQAVPLPVLPPDAYRLALLDAKGAEEANAALVTLYAEGSTESLLEGSQA